MEPEGNVRHFLTTQDWSQAELSHLLQRASEYKTSPIGDALQNKTVALVFFNPSLRTRSSFEIGVFQLSGHAVVLSPGKDAWPIEMEPGAVMDGDSEEHIIEAARVLSRYCDAIAVRAFPKFQNWQEDRQDKVIRAFAEHTNVPVINMETIVHPCQELALMQTIHEHLGKPQNKKFVLTWTYHPKPLNTAVANSALLIASKFGMDVTLLCPNEDYLLDQRYMQAAKDNASEYGSSLVISHDIQSAYKDADFVYAKSWGALPYFGNWAKEKPIRDQYRHFIVDENKMALTNHARFSHCLPARRNVKMTDAVMDADYCVAVDEAENRLHVQKALMDQLLNGNA